MQVSVNLIAQRSHLIPQHKALFLLPRATMGTRVNKLRPPQGSLPLYVTLTMHLLFLHLCSIVTGYCLVFLCFLTVGFFVTRT